MDFVCYPDAPEDQSSRDDDDVCCEKLETLLGFHNATVATGEFYREPVAESAGERGAE